MDKVPLHLELRENTPVYIHLHTNEIPEFINNLVPKDKSKLQINGQTPLVDIEEPSKPPQPIPNTQLQFPYDNFLADLFPTNGSIFEDNTPSIKFTPPASEFGSRSSVASSSSRSQNGSQNETSPFKAHYNRKSSHSIQPNESTEIHHKSPKTSNKTGKEKLTFDVKLPKKHKKHHVKSCTYSETGEKDSNIDDFEYLIKESLNLEMVKAIKDDLYATKNQLEHLKNYTVCLENTRAHLQRVVHQKTAEIDRLTSKKSKDLCLHIKHSKSPVDKADSKACVEICTKNSAAFKKKRVSREGQIHHSPSNEYVLCLEEKIKFLEIKLQDKVALIHDLALERDQWKLNLTESKNINLLNQMKIKKLNQCIKTVIPEQYLTISQFQTENQALQKKLETLEINLQASDIFVEKKAQVNDQPEEQVNNEECVHPKVWRELEQTKLKCADLERQLEEERNKSMMISLQSQNNLKETDHLKQKLAQGEHDYEYLKAHVQKLLSRLKKFEASSNFYKEELQKIEEGSKKKCERKSRCEESLASTSNSGGIKHMNDYDSKLVCLEELLDDKQSDINKLLMEMKQMEDSQKRHVDDLTHKLDKYSQSNQGLQNYVSLLRKSFNRMSDKPG